MGHAEIPKAPRQGGDDVQEAEAPRFLGGPQVALGQVEIARQGGGVLHDLGPAARLTDAEEDDHDQGDGHEDALQQVRGGDGQEAAQHRVGNDDDGPGDHGGVIVHPEQAVEQGAHGLKAGRRVGDKEHQDDQRGDQGKHVLFFAVALGEKLGDRKRADPGGIAAQPFGDK